MNHDNDDDKDKEDETPGEIEPAHNPHDAYWKAVLGQQSLADVILRERLPPEIVARLAPEPPVPVPGHFIDEQLKPHLSDLLYELRLVTGDSVLLYALIEHKSSPNALTPLQLLRYMTRIWSKRGRERRGEPLPVIIPVVFYHGSQSWNAPPDFAGLFGDVPAFLLPYIPDFTYNFTDLGQIPDKELSRDPRLRALLIPPRHIFDDDWFEALLAALDELLALERMDVVLWMNYIVSAKRNFTREQASYLLRALPPSEQEDIMGGLAQEWLKEGYQRGRSEGLQQGIQQGMQQGVKQGEARLLIRLLSRRFGPLPEHIKTRILSASPTTLEHWSDRLLTARTLDDVFA